MFGNLPVIVAASGQPWAEFACLFHDVLWMCCVFKCTCRVSESISFGISILLALVFAMFDACSQCLCKFFPFEAMQGYFSLEVL